MTEAPQTLCRLALALAIAVAAAGTALAEDSVVYKWTDNDHRVHYSDTPPEGDVGAVTVETVYEHTRQSQRPAAAPPAPSKSAAAPPVPGAAPGNLQKQVAADVAKTANEQCKQAQDVYNSYLRARHIYKEGDDKSRVYLSDTEMEEARVNAKRDVDEACKGAEQ
jgi:hypothetical protein